jgi:hypothetical protein
MKTFDLISQRLGQLIAEGRQILEKYGWDGFKYKALNPPYDVYLRIRTEAMNLVRRSCGENSDHYRELRRLADSNDSANNGFYLIHVMGVLEAAKLDFDAGLLFDTQQRRPRTFWQIHKV